jgi:hypothetical protein
MPRCCAGNRCQYPLLGVVGRNCTKCKAICHDMCIAVDDPNKALSTYNICSTCSDKKSNTNISINVVTVDIAGIDEPSTVSHSTSISIQPSSKSQPEYIVNGIDVTKVHKSCFGGIQAPAAKKPTVVEVFPSRENAKHMHIAILHYLNVCLWWHYNLVLAPYIMQLS